MGFPRGLVSDWTGGQLSSAVAWVAVSSALLVASRDYPLVQVGVLCASAAGGSLFAAQAVRRLERQRVASWLKESEQSVALRVIGDLFAEVPAGYSTDTEAFSKAINGLLVATSEERVQFAQTVDRIGDGVMTVTPDTGRILGINRAGVRIFGRVNAGEIVGERLSVLIWDSDDCDRLLRTGGCEFEITTAGDERATIFAQATHVNDEEGAALAVVFRNITEQRELEAALGTARDAAIEAARLKSEFLANMSHEIRTPMNGIIGMTDLLMESRLTPDQRELTRTIASSADSLLRIINDILDFSKIEAGKLTVEKTEFDFLGMLRDLRALFAAKASEKSVSLVFDVHDNVPPTLVGDPTRIRQVLLNLLSNALKFTEKGSVTMRVAPSVRAGEWLEIHVRDTGIGMTPEQCANVFEKFVQADASTTRKFGGTGLGLSITKQLVDLMGGSVRVSSEFNVGSTFSVLLELPRGQGIPVEKEAPVSRQQFAFNVLLVEDNATNQAVAARFLSKLGCSVKVANHGQEAVEILQQEEFDLVFMDCQMPIMDGYEATRAIRNITGSMRSVHIVAMTASAMIGDRERCIEVGMNDYLTKPIRLPQLRHTLANVAQISKMKVAGAA